MFISFSAFPRASGFLSDFLGLLLTLTEVDVMRLPYTQFPSRADPCSDDDSLYGQNNSGWEWGKERQAAEVFTKTHPQPHFFFSFKSSREMELASYMSV